MKIFISYRRDDSSGYAGRLFDYLAARFGKENVFMDVDTIKPGEDFRRAIEKAVGSCEVVIVMIGRQWLSAADAQGRRRLDDTGDFVRVEVANALANPAIRVIPVLVRDAGMPHAKDLPDDLKDLAYRNATELSDHRFQYDAQKLIEVIKGDTKPAVSPVKLGGAILAIAVLVLAFWGMKSGMLPFGASRTPTPTQASTATERAIIATATTFPTQETIPPTATSIPTATSVPISPAVLTVDQYFKYINSANIGDDLEQAWDLMTPNFQCNPSDQCNQVTFEKYWLAFQVQYKLYDCGPNTVVAELIYYTRGREPNPDSETHYLQYQLIDENGQLKLDSGNSKSGISNRCKLVPSLP